MLEQIGGFDDSFFFALEDADVAWRAQMQGWRCLYVPAAVVHHHHGATIAAIRKGSSLKQFHVGRNRVRMLAKNADAGQLRRYGLAMIGYDLAYVAFAAVTERTLAPLRGRVQGLREWRLPRAGARGGRWSCRLPAACGPRCATGGLAPALRRHSAARRRPPRPRRPIASRHGAADRCRRDALARLHPLPREAAMLLPAAGLLYVLRPSRPSRLAAAPPGGLVATLLALVVQYWYQGVVVRAVVDMEDGRRDFSMGDLLLARPRRSSGRSSWPACWRGSASRSG